MEITVKFDLDNEQDRKHYQAWVKIKEITLNLDKLGQMLFDIDECQSNEVIVEQLNSVYKFFDQMICKKLN